MSTRNTLRRALELAPDLDVVVRANKDKDIELLYQLGAKEVVQPEFEASLELVSHLLTRMGMSFGAIQRQAQEIRKHHYLEFRPQLSASQVSRELELATQDMNSRWYSLPANSPLSGMTLAEADLRNLAGVNLMAIRRASGEEVDYPDVSTIIEEGDRLLVVGQSEELAALDELAKGKAVLPATSAPCQWILVPENSPFVGKTLAHLDIERQYGVKASAIRREGKFIRDPEDNIELQVGDRILLCGGYHPLQLLQQSLIPPEQISTPVVPVVKAAESQGLREYLPMDNWREP